MSSTKALRNPLLHTLVHLRGNPRACLWVEPLWGIPYNLYLPFVSVFMAALGMTPTQIGVVSTVFLASQMVWALLSGVLTDKLGRRLATLIFDVLSWSVPALLWMFAQGFPWFLVAAVFNGAWRVTETSWGLLLVEDAPNDQLVHLFSISHIAGLVAGFVAPIAYFFVQKYTVVPTMRVLYLITFVLMTTKFILLYCISRETGVGERRRAQCRNVSIWRGLLGNGPVLLRMLRNRRTMYIVGLIACFSGMRNVSDTFWPLLVTQRLGVAAENLSVFSTVKSLLMLAAYFFLVPRISIQRFKRPLLISFALMVGQQVSMLIMPPGAYAWVVLTVVLEAAALSMLNPVTASLQMLTIEREERARMLGLFYAMCLLVTSPLGTVAGALAELNPTLPFWLNLGLSGLAIALSLLITREVERSPMEETV